MTNSNQAERSTNTDGISLHCLIQTLNLDLWLKGQSHKIFCTWFFINQFILVPLEMSMDRFIFMLFHRVIALLKRFPGTFDTGEYPKGRESLFFYLDTDIGPLRVNFKTINLKFSQIVGHIVFLKR